MDITHETVPPPPTSLYRLAGVSKIYRKNGRDIPAVRDLDLEIRAGEWLAVQGKTGHGKSTLLQLLGGLDRVVLLLAALFRRGNLVPKFWLLATLLTTLVFTNLVLMHWHYYLMCCLPVALLCGATLARWENFFAQEISGRCLRLVLVGLVLVLSALEGIIAMKISLDYDGFPQEMSVLLRQYTKPEDKLLVFKCDPEWGGEVLFRAGRKGLVVPTLESPPRGQTKKGLLEILDNEVDLRRLKSLGYNKLVLMSESPVRFAVQAVNPGSQRKRFFYPATISQKVDAWPEVYRSEDILIRDIPDAP